MKKNNVLWWLVGGAFVLAIFEVASKNKKPTKPLYSSKVNTGKLIDTLHPLIKQRAIDFVNDVKKRLGIDLHVVQALRTIEEQNALYAKGRTAQGSIVTNAKGGDSYHNYGLAFDVAPFVNGKLDYNIKWEPVAAIGKEHGFKWGGDFKSIKDKPHFEDGFGKSVHQLYALSQKQGKTYLDIA